MIRKRYKQLLLTGCLFFFPVSILFAQDFEKYLSPQIIEGDSIIQILSEFDNTKNDSVINAYYDRIVALRKSWLNGINATSTFSANSKPIGIDEEFYGYKQKVSIGLQWDLLKDGQKISNLKAQEENLKRQVTLKQHDKLNLLIKMEEKRMLIEQTYMEELAYWKNLEYHINTIIAYWYKKAYFQDIVTRLDFEIAQQRYQLVMPTMEKLDTFSIDSVIPILPLYHIDKEFLNNLDSLVDRETEILSVSKELADKKASKLNEISFSPNVRFNAFDQNGKGFSSTYLSYGVSLKVPFSVAKKKANYLENEMLQLKFNTTKATKNQEITTQYHQVFRYIEEINFNQYEINKLEIENNGKIGDYFNVQVDYYNRLLLIIHYKKKIALQKRNAFYTLTNIIEKSESTLVFDYIVFY